MGKIWSSEELNIAVKLHESGLRYEEIGIELDRTKKSIKEKLGRLGYVDNKINKHEKVICECCGNEFESLISDKRKYCSQSCSAKITGSKYPKRRKKYQLKNVNVEKTKRIGNSDQFYTILTLNCLYCGEKFNIGKHLDQKYCSIKCSHSHKKSIKYKKIEENTGEYGSKACKAYLIDKYGEKCMKCGWSEVNPTSGKIPIELEHKDGDSSNNNLNNLELLCPNHHSLTPTYKALNKGNGRHKRKLRYKEGKSY